MKKMNAAIIAAIICAMIFGAAIGRYVTIFGAELVEDNGIEYSISYNGEVHGYLS